MDNWNRRWRAGAAGWARLLALAAWCWAGAAGAAPGIFLQHTHPVSARSAVLEDDGHVAYLFLTAAGSFVPERQVAAYTRKPPVASVDWWELKLTGDTAPIWRDVASAHATIPEPRAQDLEFRWSQDGHAVSLLRNGRPIAFVTSSHVHGYSKALTKPSVLGAPWDKRLYQLTFQ
jgi:hypothetical protein